MKEGEEVQEGVEGKKKKEEFRSRDAARRIRLYGCVVLMVELVERLAVEE